jgi:acyl-CoA thioester hydrolase
MDFKHTVPVQLRFNDVDGLGHVNNSVYFSFYDLGKTEYFKTINGGVLPTEVDIVVAHAEVDFIAPVFLSDEIAVQTMVSEIGNKSFELMQRIIDTKHNIVKCRCKTVMVGFDFKNNCSKPISDEWRNAISAYEGVQF